MNICRKLSYMKDRLLKLNILMNRNYQKIRKSKNKNEVNQYLNPNFE